jgi:hypothetical protein
VATDGRDPQTGRLLPGHAVRPRRRGGPSDAELIRKKLAPHREEVLAKLIELAKAGDPRSQQLFLAYLSPPAKPDAERIAIPGFMEAATLEQKASAILNAMATGAIGIEVALQVLQAVGLYARAGKADELERRLLALEQRDNPKPLTPTGDGAYEAKT